jgi:dihydrofolate reductase
MESTEENTMRKIAAGLFITLDGVMGSPDQWQFPYFNEELGQAVTAQMDMADTMLLGRQTYQEFAAFWPTADANDPFTARMNNTPKYVVSTTLDTVEWQNSTLIKGNVAEELTRLKQQPGKNIGITGSATLVRSLLRDNLLDELVLLIHPLVVGSGKRLFAERGDPVALKLVETKTTATGVVILTYQPAEHA